MEQLAASRVSPLKKCLFYLIPFAVVLVFFELGLRALGYGPLPATNITLSSTGYFCVADKTLGFRNRPDGVYVNAAFERAPVVTTDHNGYRNGFSPAKETAHTVIFVGDSATFCAEVNDNETGPSEVARILSLKGLNAHVVNAGVRGYSTLQSKRMLDETVRRFPGAEVAVYVYSDNDLYENLNSIYLPMIAPTASWNEEAASVFEKEVDSEPVPWGSDFVGVAARPGTALGKRILAASHSALAYNIQSSVRTLLEWRSSKGAAKGGSPPIASHEYALQRNGDKVLESLIVRMRSTCERAGVRFMVTQFTNGSKAGIDRWLGEICRRSGVQFIAINDKFKGSPGQYEVRFAGNLLREGHYNTLGTRTFAEGVAPSIYSAIASK